MKIGVIAFSVSSLAFSVYGQQSEVRQLPSFQAVRASEAIDVYLKKGDKETAKVEVSGVELDEVLTEVNGTTLKVHMREGNYHGKRTVKVYVTYRSVNRLSASSASNVFSEGTIQATSMDINVSSAGSVEISLQAESVVVDASSAGDVVIEGKARSIDVEASSAGDIDAYNLETETAQARVSSGGSAKINVTKELEAHASSGGNVRYRGNPMKTNTDSSSGGSVKKTN